VSDLPFAEHRLKPVPRENRRMTMLAVGLFLRFRLSGVPSLAEREKVSGAPVALCLATGVTDG
jgi:hypothetical protein